MRDSTSRSFEPVAKKLKSDLTFQCIVCNNVHSDFDAMFEHMRYQHPELYEHENERISCEENSGVGDENSQLDFDHELSDEEYSDLSRILEPICELRQIDDDEPSDIQDYKGREAEVLENSDSISTSLLSEELRLHIQLQLQLQNRLLELRKNNCRIGKNSSLLGRPLSLRKFISCQLYNEILIFNLF